MITWSDGEGWLMCGAHPEKALHAVEPVVVQEGEDTDWLEWERIPLRQIENL